jgi:hypothetical protein
MMTTGSNGKPTSVTFLPYVQTALKHIAGHCPGPTVEAFATQEDLQLLKYNMELKTLEGNGISFQVS